MKMELPFAVALIACGSLLWSTRAPAERQAQTTGGSNQPIATAAEYSDSQISSPDNNFQPIQNEGPRSFAPANPSSQPTHRLAVAVQSPDIAADSTTNQSNQNFSATTFATPRSLESKTLLQQSARLLSDSPPIQTRAKMTINQFGQSLKVQGRYLQQGQGTRRARFDFKYQDEDTRFQVMQMCDGRFFYSLSAINDRSSLEFVDLQSVSDSSSGPLSFSAGPTGWISTGGVASLLEHLSVAFDFQPSSESEIAGVPMITLRGQWNKVALETMLTGQVNPKAFASGPQKEIDWEKMPKQIPHAVEIMVGKDSFLNLFPYRIQFSQFHRPETDSKAENQHWVSRPMMTLELFEVTKVADIPIDDFRIDTPQLEPINATEKYMQRVAEFEHYETLKNRKQADQNASVKTPHAQSAKAPGIRSSNK